MINQIVSWAFAIVCLLGIINMKWTVQSIFLCYVMRAIGHTFSISFVVLNLGGIIIYHKDFLIICLVIKIFLNHKSFGVVPRKMAWVYICFIFAICSMVLGFIVNGFGYRFVGDIRKFIGFFIPILYIAVEGKYYDREYIEAWLNRYMSFMLIFCLICWGQLFIMVS